MNKVSKKDLDEAQRIKYILAEDGSSDSEAIKDSLESVVIRSKRKALVNYDLAGTFHSLDMHFIDKAIAERLIDENISLMIQRIQLSARFGYLNSLTGGEQYSGGYDCMHVFSVLKALAVQDQYAVEAFLKRFSAPFAKGHKSTVLLCNAVYAALGHHDNLDFVTEKLRAQKDIKFFRGMYDCLLGLILSDEEGFLQGFQAILKLNRRFASHSSMEKIVSIEAHAMYSLLVNHSKMSSSIIKSHSDFPWDNLLQIKLASNKTSSLIDLSNTNSILNKWVNNLPAEVDVQELLASLV